MEKGHQKDLVSHWISLGVLKAAEDFRNTCFLSEPGFENLIQWIKACKNIYNSQRYQWNFTSFQHIFVKQQLKICFHRWWNNSLYEARNYDNWKQKGRGKLLILNFDKSLFSVVFIPVKVIYFAFWNSRQV